LVCECTSCREKRFATGSSDEPASDEDALEHSDGDAGGLSAGECLYLIVVMVFPLQCFRCFCLSVMIALRCNKSF